MTIISIRKLIVDMDIVNDIMCTHAIVLLRVVK